MRAACGLAVCSLATVGYIPQAQTHIFRLPADLRIDPHFAAIISQILTDGVNDQPIRQTPHSQWLAVEGVERRRDKQLGRDQLGERFGPAVVGTAELLGGEGHGGAGKQCSRSPFSVDVPVV